MKTTDLKELGEKIKKARAIATSDPGTEPNTRRMRLGNINQAKEELAALSLAYRQQILANAIFVLVTGDDADKFAAIAEKKYDCFSVDVEDFYKEMVKNIPTALYKGKTASGNLLEFISSNMEEKARSLNIVSFPALVFDSKYKKALKDDADLLKLTKIVINEKVGGEIVGLDAADRVFERLLQSELSGKKVPIILQVKDASMVEDISKGLKRSLTRKTFVISTGSEVDQKIQNISFETLESVTVKSVEKSLVNLNKSLV